MIYNVLFNAYTAPKEPLTIHIATFKHTTTLNSLKTEHLCVNNCFRTTGEVY